MGRSSNSNDEPLWLAIRMTIEAFLLSLFNQGALQGTHAKRRVPAASSATKSTHHTPPTQQNGVVNIVIGVAPCSSPPSSSSSPSRKLAGKTS